MPERETRTAVRPRRGEVRIKQLRRVFNFRPDDMTDAYLGCLAVLYEDLRIEVAGIRTLVVAPMDELDPVSEVQDNKKAGAYRRLYFLRRSIGTLHEFSDALRQIEGCSAFRTVKAAFEGGAAKTWTEALDFFGESDHLLKNVRNDVGGHLGPKASREAIRRFGARPIGKIEVEFQDNMPRRPFLHFAGEIAAAAFGLHRSPDDGDETEFANFMNKVVDGYKHATTCVEILAGSYLWPRFG